MAYLPAFVTEWKTDRPLDDCGPSSAAMLVDYATQGAVRPGRAGARAACGKPDRPKLADPVLVKHLAKAVRALAGPAVQVEWSNEGGLAVGWPGFMARLQDGWGAVLNGMHKDLPPHRCGDPKYLDGHSVFVCWNSGLWMMEPLVNSTKYGGELVDEEMMGGFAASFADRQGHVECVMARPMEKEMQLIITDRQPVLCELAEGVQVKQLGGGLLMVVGKGGGHRVLSPFAVDGERRAVIVKPGQLQQLGIVKESDCSQVSPIPDDTAWRVWYAKAPKD